MELHKLVLVKLLFNKRNLIIKPCKFKQEKERQRNIEEARREEQEKALAAKSANVPKCPTCGSTKVHPISSGKKALGYITVGIFSSNFGKSYKCDNYKYKW